MARKKFEFRPDRKGLGLLHKLYLTRRQRLSLLRWSLFALVLLVLSLLQDVILCHMSIFGATTDLVPCAIFLITMLLGTETGSGFALIAACLYQFSGTGPGYHAIAIITVLCIAGAMFRQTFLHKSFAACLLCAGVCQLLYSLTVFFVGVFLGQAPLGRVYVAALTALLSCLTLPPLYPIVRAIEKIGGDPWKD